MAKQQTSAVQTFVDTVQKQQTQVLDARDDMTEEIVEHMMQLPGLAEVFSHEEDRQAFAAQLAMLIENSVRMQVGNQRNRDQFRREQARLRKENAAAE